MRRNRAAFDALEFVPDETVYAARSRGAPDRGQRRPSVQYRSMLSSRRPLVSGTKRQMNAMASPAKIA